MSWTLVLRDLSQGAVQATLEDIKRFSSDEVVPVVRQLRQRVNVLFTALNAGAIDFGVVVIRFVATAPPTQADPNGSFAITPTGIYSRQGGIWVLLGAGGAGVPATTVVSETAFDQALAVGASLNYAREDHTHGSPPLATAVVTETAFGQAPAVGVGTKAAKDDHTHGTPATPVTSLTAGAGLTGGGTGAVTVDVIAADATIVVNADSIQVGTITDANIDSSVVADADIARIRLAMAAIRRLLVQLVRLEMGMSPGTGLERVA